MASLTARRSLCTLCSAAARTLSTAPAASSGRLARAGPGPSTLYFRSLRHFSSTALRRARIPNPQAKKTHEVDMKQFPRDRIRNLSIIAHIDHGKSTLADRLLQMTGTVPDTANAQFLDKLKVERERGITVKAQTVSIIHTHTDGQRYLINLIDTPGHVDFSYEVSRSIGACEGGLILVDCTQGIQAQTLSVFHVALEADLKLLAVINKVDLPHASPEETSLQIEGTLGLESEEHMYISAKSGLGVEKVLNQIVEGLPPPRQWEDNDGKLRALVFDTHYDHYRGVVALIRVFSGEVKVGDKIRFLQADRKFEVLEIGINNPEETPVDVLREGQVGYLICSMKNSDEAHIGDTICLDRDIVEPLPGFKPMKAMVYAGVFPMENSEFGRLEEAMGRLTLNDRSVTVAKESSTALSQGFRLGFLGTLHMDVFRQRLEDEYSSEVIITAPTVPYKITYANGQVSYVSNPAEFPDGAQGKMRARSIEEPMVIATIIVPNEYLGAMMDLCSSYRGTQLDYKVLETSGRSMLKYSFPLSEIVTDFFSALKSASSGFASFDYEDAGYEQSDMVKMNMLLNGRPVDALAMIVHRSAVQKVGKEWVKKLKEVVPRQYFELAIQAAVGGKVYARETLPAMRKDVTAGLYGGHFERKLKQLTKQKEGKKRLKMLAGNIEVPQSAFYQVLSSRPRSFSTYTRLQSSAQTSMMNDEAFQPLPPNTGPDHVLENFLPDLDGLPSKFERHERRKHEPLSRLTQSPISRSKHLAGLYKAGTVTPSNTSIKHVYTAYTQAFHSSPYGSMLSPDEIMLIIKQIVRISEQKARGNDRAAVDSQVRTVIRHLTDLTGGDASGFVLGVLLRIEPRSSKRHSEFEIATAEARIRSLMAENPGPRLEDCRDQIDYFMGMLSVMRTEEGKFEQYWEELFTDRLTPQARNYADKLRYFSILDDDRRFQETLGQALEASINGKRYILNTAMIAFAEKGQWGRAAEIYIALTGHSDVGFPLDRASCTLSIPPMITANRQSYSLLLRQVALAGYLEGSLRILKEMYSKQHVPFVYEYLSLFSGFQAFGEIAPQTGSALELFPRVETFMVGRTVVGQRLENVSRSNDLQNFVKIWERGRTATAGGSTALGEHSGAALSSGPSDPEKATENEWRLKMFHSLFEAFMALQPGTRMVPDNTIAPGPQFVWGILMAVSRMTGGDHVLIKQVWDAMNQKFKGETGEKWFEWRLNNRLERVVKGLEELDRKR